MASAINPKHANGLNGAYKYRYPKLKNSPLSLLGKSCCRQRVLPWRGLPIGGIIVVITVSTTRGGSLKVIPPHHGLVSVHSPNGVS